MTDRGGDVDPDSLTFFPSLNDASPTNTVRHAPQASRSSIHRPSITSLLFTPRTARGRDPLFGNFDPLANELSDALQEHTSPAHLEPNVNEFEGLERCTSAPPRESNTNSEAARSQKKPGRRKHGASISSIPAYFKPKSTTMDKGPTATVSQHVPRPSSSMSKGNVAPVEMGSWFLQEHLPPALSKRDNGQNTTTDEFGFLYEEKRRRKQHDGNRRLSMQLSPAQTRSPVASTFPHHRLSSVSLPLDQSPAEIDDEDEKAANMRWHDFLTLDTNATASYLSDMPLLGANRIMDRVRAAVGGYSSTQGPLNKSEAIVAVSTPTVVSPATEAFTESLRSETSSATNVSVHTQDTSNASPSGPSQTAATLLQQLNDDHERSQQKKKLEFEDFMNKSLVHRLRGNDEGTGGSTSRLGDNANQHISPEAHLVEGSIIGFASIGLGAKGAKNKRKELHRLILQGIPVELRSKVWGECMRSQVQGDPEYYQALLTNPIYAGLDDSTTLEAIDADVQRTLKDNIYFRDMNGAGARRLTDVLIALARHNPQVGYCQGMNLIVGSLILVLPTAEEAFWIMVFLMESILPLDYMGATLLMSRADAKVLRTFVIDLIPALAQHLERHDVWLEFEVNAISWFVSAFTAVFCGEALYRVWDVMFCWNDGDLFAFCTALALLKLNERALLACQGRSETSGYLNGRMTDHAVSVDGVIKAASALRKVVRKEDVEKRRRDELYPSRAQDACPLTTAESRRHSYFGLINAHSIRFCSIWYRSAHRRACSGRRWHWRWKLLNVTVEVLQILNGLSRFNSPPGNAIVFIPVSDANSTHRPANYTFGQLWELQVALWNEFLWPSNLAQTAAINSSLFSDNVQGRVDVTRTFDGRELNTEHIFGLFSIAALNNAVPSMIGYPVSYKLQKFAASQSIASASTVFSFYINILRTSIPFVIDTWITFDAEGKISQYDALFKRLDYAIDSAYGLWQAYLRKQPGRSNATLSDTQAWVKTESIAAICLGHQLCCTDSASSMQYNSTAACVDYLSKVPFGQGYQAGMDTILCRTIHLNMVPLRPSVHRPHIGPSGGGMCVNDQTYPSKVLIPYFHNEPFMPYEGVASGRTIFGSNGTSHIVSTGKPRSH